MRLTFVVLFACWTIYSSNRSVLSLPPSLIAKAASLLQQQQQHQHQRSNFKGLWHKDVVEKRSTDNTKSQQQQHIANANDQLNNIGQNNENNQSQTLHPRISRMAKIASTAAIDNFDAPFELKPKLADVATAATIADTAYDLSGLLQGTAAISNEEAMQDSNKDEDDTSQSSEELTLPLPLPLPLPLRSRSPQEIAIHGRDAKANANEFFTPLKYWARHCQPDKDCPKQSYRLQHQQSNGSLSFPPELGRNNQAIAGLPYSNLLNRRNKTENFEELKKNVALAMGHPFSEDDWIELPNGDLDFFSIDDDFNPKYAIQEKPSNDVFMYLNGEKELIKFLQWAMQTLYPYDKFANYNGRGAEYYHPGMYIWKKLNLSGNLEPPLFVDEPHYIIVRREQLNDDFNSANYKTNDPFIPPRGRKQNKPDLDSLLQRYEPFVPNRGRRVNIKDMLKSNDLFFPNRGKKLKPPTNGEKKRQIEYENGSSIKSLTSKNNNQNLQSPAANIVDIIENKSSHNDDADDDNDYDDVDNDNDDDWSMTAAKAALPVAALAMRDVLEKLFQRKLQNEQSYRQQQAAAAAAGNKITTNVHEKSNDGAAWLQTILNYKFNGYDPSVKQSMPAAVAINGETREMSTPQKVTAENHALQLLFHRNLKKSADIGSETDATANDDAWDMGVDTGGGTGNGGGMNTAANRLFSTRSMLTAMTHRRQQLQPQQQHQQEKHQKHQKQQRQRLRQRQQQRHLTALLQQFNADRKNAQEDNLQQLGRNQKLHSSERNHHHYRDHQVKSLTNLVPLLWRQHDSMQHLQKIHHRHPTEDSFSQENRNPLLDMKARSENFDIPHPGDTDPPTDDGTDKNYNYFDI